MAVIVTPTGTRNTNQDASQLRVYARSFISAGPPGTPLPTAVSSTLDATMVDFGWLSDSGITESQNKSQTDIRNYSGGTLRTIVTQGTWTATFEVDQATQNNVEWYYNQHVDPATASIVVNPTSSLRGGVFVIDLADGANMRRYVIDKGSITATMDQKHGVQQASILGYTLTAYPSPNILGPNGEQSSVRIFDTDFAAAVVPAAVPAVV